MGRKIIETCDICDQMSLTKYDSEIVMRFGEGHVFTITLCPKHGGIDKIRQYHELMVACIKELNDIKEETCDETHD